MRDNRRTAVRSCHDVGKDWIAAQLGAWWLSCNDPGEAFLVTLAPTHHQVRGILWREINRAHAAGSLPGRVNQTEWWHGNELVGFGRSPADTDPTAIQGIHARKVFVVLDEACGISKELIDAADSLIANEDSRMLAIGNPDDPSTEFKRLCDPGSGWNVIGISVFESPNFTDEYIPDAIRPLLVSRTWVEEKRQSWGEDSMLWTSKVLGKFPEQSADSLIPAEALTKAHERFAAAVEGQPHDLGIDVARMGNDKTVFCRRKGWKVWFDHSHTKRDLMETVGEVIRACKRDKPYRIKIDDAGLGGGVTDRLRELQRTGDDGGALRGVKIIPVNVGEGAEDDLPPWHPDRPPNERFKNLRARLNWAVREMLTDPDAKLAIQPDQEFDSQVMQVKYKPLSTGEIFIEKKEDMKKRTKGVSPDKWDAFVLAVAENVKEPQGGIAGTGFGI